jgi:anti-sigma regulatory factor (Ser/Thr protein kinase)
MLRERPAEAVPPAGAFAVFRCLHVTALPDRQAAGALAALAARTLAFPARAQQACSIVACELAENAVRYAGGGQVEVSVASGEGWVRVAVSDQGPRFHDLALAFQDGSTDRGPVGVPRPPGRVGLGSGLGAVRRLSVRVVVTQGRGTKRLEAYLTADERRLGEPCPLVVTPGDPGPG